MEGDAYDSRVVIFVPRLIPKIREFLRRLRAKRLAHLQAEGKVETPAPVEVPKEEVVVSGEAPEDQVHSETPAIYEKLEAGEGEQSAVLAAARSFSISTQKSGQNYIKKNSTNPLFSRQSTGETTQNREVVSASVLGEGLHSAQNREKLVMPSSAGN